MSSTLETVGFEDIRLCYPSLRFIGGYPALQFDAKGPHQHATTLGAWSENSGGLFALAWVSAVGSRP